MFRLKFMLCLHYVHQRTSTHAIAVIKLVDFYCSIHTAHVDARLRMYIYVLIELSSIRTYMLRTFRRMSAHQYALMRSSTCVCALPERMAALNVIMNIYNKMNDCDNDQQPEVPIWPPKPEVI